MYVYVCSLWSVGVDCTGSVYGEIIVRETNVVVLYIGVMKRVEESPNTRLHRYCSNEKTVGIS